MKINLSDLLSLPIEAITNTFAVFGIRGSGKSNIGAVMAEGIIKAGQPVCIIDPTGAWFGLKSSADGKSPGLPVYIFGGEHADIPLEPTAGEVLANFVVDRRVPVVLDLKLMRKHEQIKFVLTFAETLFHRNREPLMVIIDETARFAPQIIKDRSPEAARCLGAIEDLATLGRSRGVGVTLLAQRPAPVSTTLRTQIENLICLRTIGKHDRKALDEWVEAKGSQQERDQMMKDLADLPDGMGYFWSPGWLHKFIKTQFYRRETYDSGRTPKVGERIAAPKAFAAIDKAQLSAEIQATIERAKADDPAELRKQIAELKKQLGKSPAPAPAAEVKRVEVPILKDGQLNRIESLVQKFQDWNDLQLAAAKERAEIVLSALRDLTATLKPLNAVPMNTQLNRHYVPPSAPLVARQPQERRPEQPAKAQTHGDLTGPEQRILDAIAWMESIGVDCPEQVAVAFLAGYTYGGGAFNNPRGAVRTKGLVEYVAGDCIRLTDSGRALANIPDQALDSSELQGRILLRLPGPERKILEVLLKNYPTPISNEQCARESGYTPNGGAYNNPRGRLRTLGLIEYQSGMVVAKPLLFLESR